MLIYDYGKTIVITISFLIANAKNVHNLTIISFVVKKGDASLPLEEKHPRFSTTLFAHNMKMVHSSSFRRETSPFFNHSFRTQYEKGTLLFL